MHYRNRLGDGRSAFTASPVAGDGKIYIPDEQGGIHVVKTGLEFEVLAVNDMGEICMSPPAMSDGVLVVRTLKHVFGLGSKSEPMGGAE